MSNLVPTDEVAVDVDITKTTHHLNLVLCVFLIFSLAIVAGSQKGEAVGDFQGGGIVQTQQLSCVVLLLLLLLLEGVCLGEERKGKGGGEG